ncbi:MAG: type II toxin-antitoxin system RelE/ParE family toxin [Spirochaetia bacterium]
MTKRSSNEDEKDELTALFEFFADCNGQLRNKRIRSEGDKLFAFKPKPHRFLAFFVKDKTVTFTHGFEKKQEKLPRREKANAQESRRDY